MKKSASIQLFFVNTIVIGVSGCDSEPTPVDPCNTTTFNAPACETAVQNKGYNYHGAWVPMVYPSPYLFYYAGYTRLLGAGRPVYSAPASVYAGNYRSLDSREWGPVPRTDITGVGSLSFFPFGRARLLK